MNTEMVAKLDAELARTNCKTWGEFYRDHKPEIEALRAQIRREQGLGAKLKRWAIRYLILTSALIVSTLPAHAAWVWLNPFGIWGSYIPNIPVGWWP